MLTPDQVRMRLDQIVHLQDRASGLLYLLHDVLPDLVAAVHKTDDAGSRYAGDRSRQCENQPGWRADSKYQAYTVYCDQCKPNEPCARARQLTEGA